MPNAMPETSDTECGDRESEHPESTPLTTLNVEDIRTSGGSLSNELESDPGSESHDYQVGLSSLMNRSNEVLSSGGNEEKAGFSTDDGIGSCAGGSILRERDYIGFSDAASSLARGERVEKEKAAEEEKFIARNKLGPKTKETELRLGLPEEDVLLQKEGHLENFVSIRGTDSKNLSEENKTESCLERSVQRGMAEPGARSTCLENNPCGLVVAKSGGLILDSGGRIGRGSQLPNQIFSDFPARGHMRCFGYPNQALNLVDQGAQTRFHMGAANVKGHEYAKKSPVEDQGLSSKEEFHCQERKLHEFPQLPVPSISSLKDPRLPASGSGVFDLRFSPQDDVQKHWQNSFLRPSEFNVRTPNSQDVSHHAQEYNGRGFLLPPKNIVAGAKRGFSDALGAGPGSNEERASLMPATSVSGVGATTEMESKVSSQQQLQKPAQAPTFMYPWPGGSQFAPNTWQMNWEQQAKGAFGQLAGHMPARGPLANGLPGDGRNNCIAEQVSAPNSQTMVKPLHESFKLPSALATSEKKQNPVEHGTTPKDNGASAESRAPQVVGWPPVRSFRKNLASQPKVATQIQVNASGDPSDSADPGLSKPNTMFVKVNVDGIPIGRKIDLKAYDSYEKLSLALDEMFPGSINAANLSSEANQPSLLNGSDYVFVYEDNEGDRMLVGDVPWEMFVSTVKRLRVMKGADARSLAANRQPLKPSQ